MDATIIEDTPLTDEILGDTVPALTQFNKNNGIKEDLMISDISDFTESLSISRGKDISKDETCKLDQALSQYNHTQSLIKVGDRPLPKTKGNKAIRGALINPDLDKGNILTSEKKRIRVKEGAWAQQYFLSFSTASLDLKKERSKLTMDSFPPAPKGWQQMIRHRFAAEFTIAVEREYYPLEEKET
ncbi:hypothetical protein GcC1_131007 [Golovinomyces cichoracearum]|uniref:Uncharacterized protein n=1 Tax=Golovinomyces cichoracearum TaxID=62708 RepID=A0A420I4L3_9PEZI|nr:hypothetical protein GcC1_131007 [Golovinomyces cichoracearum]